MSLAIEPGNQTPDAQSNQPANGTPSASARADSAQRPAEGHSPEQASRPATTNARHSFLQAFQSLLYVIVVALFVITFTAQPFRIPSPSMEPTLLIGDFLLVDKQTGAETPPRLFAPIGQVRRGDLIVFHYSLDPALHLVKRVIGLPGDRLRLRDGRVFINGQPLAEPYAVFAPSGPDAFRDEFPSTSAADPDVDYRWWVQMRSLISNGELTVPPGSYFVLGDNRNNSKDSRYWGFVPAAAVVGKPWLVYFSLNTPEAPVSGSQPAASAGSGLDFARWNRTLRILR